MLKCSSSFRPVCLAIPFVIAIATVTFLVIAMITPVFLIIIMTTPVFLVIAIAIPVSNVIVKMSTKIDLLELEWTQSEGFE
jgi:hypothetical protein